MKTWEQIYQSKSHRNKNKWPSTDVVSLIKNIKKKVNILEIGSGWGNNLRFFKEERLNYLGIEQSKTAYKFSKKKYKKVILGNFLDCDFKKKFDVIIDRQCMQHNKKRVIKLIIKKIKNLLNKNGIFFSEIANHKIKNIYTSHFSKKEILNFFSIFKKKKIKQINTEYLYPKRKRLLRIFQILARI